MFRSPSVGARGVLVVEVLFRAGMPGLRLSGGGVVSL